MDRDGRDGSDAARARDGSVCTIACLVRARACRVRASCGHRILIQNVLTSLSIYPLLYLYLNICLTYNTGRYLYIRGLVIRRVDCCLCGWTDITM